MAFASIYSMISNASASQHIMDRIVKLTFVILIRATQYLSKAFVEILGHILSAIVKLDSKVIFAKLISTNVHLIHAIQSPISRNVSTVLIPSLVYARQALKAKHVRLKSTNATQIRVKTVASALIKSMLSNVNANGVFTVTYANRLLQLRQRLQQLLLPRRKQLLHQLRQLLRRQ